MPSARIGRKRARNLTLILLTLVVIGLIGASPWFLRAWGEPTTRWERWSFIGQTYGAASALVAAFALVGIAATLILQARETKIAREEARRIAIAELLKMAMDDPALDEAWGPVPDGEDRKARRQLMYINMIVSEWQMSYETKALPERRLRAISREMFSGRPGRAYWRDARQVRMSTSETRQARRFHQILDEEYAQAPPPPPENRRGRRPWHLIAGAAVGGLALIPILRRARARRTGHDF
ncbi:DUF6082 family protein [Actinomadura algeriensis]|uniref:DUF4129 domain-containing protein n=1 Tax=Actinomadura algeriensis TaxID=1679523 RepID=A0ABR9JUM2_9ACTN|nr:DUF6082 family protein [Actinomadura algeriensis]MBE1534266.1 hypothetical protein [Actinomadura algeriensis]